MILLRSFFEFVLCIYLFEFAVFHCKNALCSSMTLLWKPFGSFIFKSVRCIMNRICCCFCWCGDIVLCSALRYSFGFEEKGYFSRAVLDSTEEPQPRDVTLWLDSEYCQQVYFHVHVSHCLYMHSHCSRLYPFQLCFNESSIYNEV